jgi:hypothetical protein
LWSISSWLSISTTAVKIELFSTGKKLPGWTMLPPNSGTYQGGYPQGGYNENYYQLDLQQSTYNAVKGKERAREAGQVWTDPISVQAGVFQGKVVR